MLSIRNIKKDRYRGIDVITRHFDDSNLYQSKVVSVLGSVIEFIDANTEEEALANHEELLQGQISAIKSAQRSLWRSCVTQTKRLFEDGFISIDDIKELIEIVRGCDEQ